MENLPLNIIIRIHKGAELRLLDEALFSLATQDYTPLNVIIVTKNADTDMLAQIDQGVQLQPWQTTDNVKIVPVNVPEDVDGRSHLINIGLKSITENGYLAFLDYDDVVYQHTYPLLIKSLSNSDYQLSAGGCRLAVFEKYNDVWVARDKTWPYRWGRDLLDLFKDNFIPIHSYVINLSRVNKDELYFDEDLDRLEDYDFLLRLGQNGEMCFSNLDIPVCEHRVRKGGHNTVLIGLEEECEKNLVHWEKARQELDRRKSLYCRTVSLLEIKNKLIEADRKLYNAEHTHMIARKIAIRLQKLPLIKKACIQIYFIAKKSFILLNSIRNKKSEIVR
jgi:hypothetical protein